MDKPIPLEGIEGLPQELLGHLHNLGILTCEQAWCLLSAPSDATPTATRVEGFDETEREQFLERLETVLGGRRLEELRQSKKRRPLEEFPLGVLPPQAEEDGLEGSGTGTEEDFQ